MKKNISNTILKKVFLRSLFIQGVWNFERLQNVGFCYSIMPALKKIYENKDKRSVVIKRHLEYFNTHPYFASMIMGTVIAMEELRSNTGEYTEDSISTIKVNMGGPLGAIGDKFFWATFRPFVAVLTIVLIVCFYKIDSFRGTWLAPLFFVIVYNAVHIAFRYWTLFISYRYHNKIVNLIASLKFQKAMDITHYIGLAVSALAFICYLFCFCANIVELLLFVALFVISVYLKSYKLSNGLIFYLSVTTGLILSFIGINR